MVLKFRMLHLCCKHIVPTQAESPERRSRSCIRYIETLTVLYFCVRFNWNVSRFSVQSNSNDIYTYLRIEHSWKRAREERKNKKESNLHWVHLANIKSCICILHFMMHNLTFKYNWSYIFNLFKYLEGHACNFVKQRK